jgi:hypothetical protein
MKNNESTSTADDKQKGADLDPAFMDLMKGAARKLDLETLEEQGADDLDFHEIHVTDLAKLLEEAYKLGLNTYKPDEFEDLEA